MEILTDSGRRAGCFIAGEANFWRSRSHALIASGVLLAGTVMGEADPQMPAGMLLSAPGATNTGNGALTVDATAPVASTARPGTYRATLTTAASNGGTFTVTDPLGAVVGTVAVAATFNNQIKFVIADGSTDFVLGDYFDLTVNRDDGLWGQWAPGGSGGIEVAAGVLFDRVDATLEPARGVVLNRDFEADDQMLIWPTGMTATQKAAAIVSLAARGIVVRTR
ncbi:head decoration protein [Roseomonas sp. F4]